MRLLAIVPTLVLLLACGGSAGSGSSAGKMTLAKFNSIQNGMDCAQLTSVVGAPGTVSADSDTAGIKTTVYTWAGAGDLGANASVTCQNGKVVLKAQAGLR